MRQNGEVTMELKQNFRRTAALLTGIMVLCSAGTVYAEDGTSTAAPTAETATTTTAEDTTQPTTAPAEPEKEEEEPEWYKAELTQYDDSLSLISYATPPEDEGKPKESKKKTEKEDLHGQTSVKNQP